MKEPNNKMLVNKVACFCLAVATTFTVNAKDTATHPEEGNYSPYADITYPERPLWGDTHLHTLISGDAIALGVLLDHEDAYQFAKGKQVTNSKGMKVRLSKPLDFLVIADHAEAYGLIREIIRGNEKLIQDERVARWRQMMLNGQGPRAAMEMVQSQSTGTLPDVILNAEGLVNEVWQGNLTLAEKHNEPGKFTAFMGFEWTSLVQGNNLHRVVMFRDGKDKVSQIIPLDSNRSGMNPEGLWNWMENYQTKTGGQTLAIPHNSNLSNGMMFALREFDGSEMSQAYAEQRIKWEPLIEMSQIKGDSEAHPFLSPNDEFADFETWDSGNLSGSQKKQNSMLYAEYAREALKSGLAIEDKINANPYKFGFIGATDSHTGLASAEENNYFGKHVPTLPSKHRATKLDRRQNVNSGWKFASGGLAAVWATENTREAIFDAMRRKEVYATTGPRMTVRLFAGWDFTEQDALPRNIARLGYQKGVPMGGDLTAAPEGKAPTLLIEATMDPENATLDRVQVVKGWLDDKGETHEKIYNVAWAGDRKVKANGKLPPIGSTVNVEAASWTNDIGAPELRTVWQDPDFDANQRAFYYLRVLEIPTPRWTAYDVKRLGAKLTDDVPLTLQERAYSSPVWYTPGNGKL